eukprot:CAMPEP_0116099102 /NCGR_PEP_ID=MMETSP0327-20121206/11587_1 /TAXON_ID=44447 /ORGANISM="Pseudo-nitzschia delicatissima, Strain B596" /LENGTH=500 /DNA_ID=CAMNT_0003590953 /DNA_START=113 /DNA_END=1615 /DNA_ORIENTATION=+
MADQKAMKKRLKALMQRPENQVCSDCPEKRPTWASLIVPPPGAPPGTEKLGSFMCLECSGSHRRIGVHITFVRSVNLDAWKEWEVRAMENGGNAKINAIFEAKLAQSGRSKPTNLADGPTRERYIRDKYERRKFYDPAGFAIQSNGAVARVSHNASGGGDFSSHSQPGAPSDVARRRVASRQARMKPRKSNPQVAKAPPVKVAQAPVSAPVEFDLLDFGSETTTTAGQTSSAENSGDVFSPRPVVSTASGMPKSSIPPPPKTAPPASMPSTFAQELLTNPATATKQTTSNDDIMALFVPSKQQQNQQPFGFGMQAMNQMRPNSSVNTNSMMNATQQTNMMAFNNQQNIMSQQQRQQMMMQNNTMVSNGNQMMPNQMMPNQMMPNQMMQQQMQQQQMMMQKQMMMQQQQMASQFHPNSSGSTNNMGMYSSTNGTNNFYGGVTNSNNMDPTIQGMRNMNIGSGVTQQSSDDGGFGTPMGGNSQQQSMKSDAFSSLGGMNAFR